MPQIRCPRCRVLISDPPVGKSKCPVCAAPLSISLKEKVDILDIVDNPVSQVATSLPVATPAQEQPQQPQPLVIATPVVFMTPVPVPPVPVAIFCRECGRDIGNRERVGCMQCDGSFCSPRCSRDHAVHVHGMVAEQPARRERRRRDEDSDDEPRQVIHITNVANASATATAKASTHISGCLSLIVIAVAAVIGFAVCSGINDKNKPAPGPVVPAIRP